MVGAGLPSRAAQWLSLVLCLALAAGVASAPPARADGLDETVSRIRKLLRDDVVEQAKVWIAALGEIEDDRVNALLRDLYRVDDDEIAIGACRTLAKRADRRFLRTLHRRVQDEDFATERPALHRESIAALGVYASPTSMKVLEGVVERAFETSPRVAITGITSYARIRERGVIDRLIRWLARAESEVRNTGAGEAADLPAPNIPGTSGGSRSRGSRRGRSGTRGVTIPGVRPPDGGLEPDRSPAEEIRRVVLRELRRITGENHPDAPVWRHWWREHRTGFRFR